MIKAIIFDFDGVILESVDVKTNAFADIYSHFGEEIKNKVIKHHTLHGGISRYNKFKIYHEQFLGIDLSDNDLNNLADTFSKKVIQKVIKAPYVTGAYEFISNHFKYYDMYISTATPTQEIEEILNSKNLMKYFKGVYGSPEEKVNHIRKILDKKDYNTKEVVFIGDSTSDRDAARKNNIQFIGRIGKNNSTLINEVITIRDMINFTKIIKGLSNIN